MANIKKNFNFRNGVQVDDDNLLVTSTGLVGIGTTVPLEALDVRGNVRISGFTSITQANIGILTVTTIKPTEIIGAGISVRSGILTAEGSGIVTFYGDARFLQGMPTSQWEDTNAGLGVSSIYNTGGTVGIGTTSPQFTLQIGGGNTNPEIGVLSKEVLSENYTIVNSLLKGTSERPEVKIDWRVYTKNPENPLIRDLIIEGLSLARTQKEEFASILNSNDNDINALFNTLEEFSKN